MKQKQKRLISLKKQEENMKKLTDEFYVDDLCYDQYYALDYQKMNNSNIENIYGLKILLELRFLSEVSKIKEGML